MKPIGACMISWGIFSIMISFVGLQFRVLWFMDEFGPVMAYVMKVGLILAGIWVWKHDKVLTEEDVPDEGKKGAWIPVIASLVVIFGIVGYVAFSTISDSNMEHRLKHPVPPAAWAATPTNRWPALVLLQKAGFEHHTSLEAGCACLIRLPSSNVVALTAGHLLGRAGGVNPGFLQGGLGGLDQAKLATLTGEITLWDLFLPGQEAKGVEVVGLFGRASDFNTDCDQILLRLSPHDRAYPVKPLDVRLESVTFGEPLHVITYAANTNGELQQVVYGARRVPGMMFTCLLEKPAVLDGCSGAPVVDKNGLLVAIVTGGTMMDINNPSGPVQAFTGHSVSELLPVFKADISGKITVTAAR